jgi:hypothetical protein
MSFSGGSLPGPESLPLFIFSLEYVRIIGSAMVQKDGAGAIGGLRSGSANVCWITGVSQ